MFTGHRMERWGKGWRGGVKMIIDLKINITACSIYLKKKKKKNYVAVSILPCREYMYLCIHIALSQIMDLTQ